VTVITPVYNEIEALSRYVERVEEVLRDTAGTCFHFVLVDDGSTDGSWDAIREIAVARPRFSGMRLSRNFGSHVALSAGIADAAGDAVCTLAADLQDPPEVLLAFLERWRAGADIVWGRRRSRDDPGFRAMASTVFGELLRRHAMPRGSRFTTGSFLLMDARVVECFRRFPERNRITFALVAWTGFDQEVVDYDRVRREAGSSKWGLGRLIKTMYDAFIGFSGVPARLMTLLGLATALLTVPFAAYLVADWWITDTVPGWTGIMVALTVFFGLQFVMMGLVGEYLYRIYTEVTGRPLYFVSDRAGPAAESEARE
jgi:dolichol-phosphate mannosyltransferase